MAENLDRSSYHFKQGDPIPTDTAVIYTTGPLAIDPEQFLIGVIVENNTDRAISFEVRIFDKDLCPKVLAIRLRNTIQSGCIFQLAFPVPGFFYEVQIAVPAVRDIFITVYGLTGDFRIIAGNTLRHSELIIIKRPTVTPHAVQTGVKKTARARWNVFQG